MKRDTLGARSSYKSPSFLAKVLVIKSGQTEGSAVPQFCPLNAERINQFEAFYQDDPRNLRRATGRCLSQGPCQHREEWPWDRDPEVVWSVGRVIRDEAKASAGSSVRALRRCRRRWPPQRRFASGPRAAGAHRYPYWNGGCVCRSP